jgi:alpha-1,4-digalacturonate transport system permease protein
MLKFLTRSRGFKRFDWTDWLSYLYLSVGLFVMFAPIVWLVMSSLKTESALSQFPPTFLPYTQKTVQVAGFDKPLPLFMTRDDQGVQRPMAHAAVQPRRARDRRPGDHLPVDLFPHATRHGDAGRG